MNCPHCGFENPEGAAACASCLRNFDAVEATPAPESGVRCQKCGLVNKSGGTQCESCLAPLAEPFPGVPSAKKRAVSEKVGKFIGGLLVLAILWVGNWVWDRIQDKAQPEPAETASEERAPAQPETRPPAPQAAAARRAPAPFKDVRTEEESKETAAEVRYRVAQNQARRGNTEKARQGFEEVIALHPSSRFAKQARVQLQLLPQREPQPRDERPDRERAFALWKERSEAERAAGRPRPTLTEEELTGLGSAPLRPRPRPGALPLSILQSARPTTVSQADRLSLVSASAEADRVTLRVAYELRAQHAAPVYAAARVSFIGWTETYFSYASDALPPGAGDTVITVQVNPKVLGAAKPASVRLMLMEGQGSRMFFSQDVPYPR